MNLNSKQAEQYTCGNSTQEWQSNGATIDTRELQQGNLFVALSGSNFNGYNFIRDAFKNGAAVAVVNKCDVKKEDLKYPLLIVEDTHRALIDLARATRNNFKGKIVAVTGSVGKTTTKEMLKLVLNNVTKVYANKGNYNNNIGMPLSLANLDNSYDVAIFELGMNHSGEIKELTNILRPHIAVITNVSNTHSAFFNSLEDIFLAKMEITSGLASPKTLIFNWNNDFFKEAVVIAKKEALNIYSFGQTVNKKNSLDIKLENNSEPNFLLLSTNITTQKLDNNIGFTQEIEARINQKVYKYNVPALGYHKALLSVLALGVVSLLDLSVEKAKDSLNNYQEIGGRGRVSKITLNKNKQEISFFIIDDSYNASPLSMQKSILMLKDISMNTRKILVLGDMLELKNQTLEHQKLKEYVLQVNPSAVFTLGLAMKELIKVLPENIYKDSHININELKQKLISYLQNDDIVLFKGSLGSNLHKVVKELKN